MPEPLERDSFAPSAPPATLASLLDATRPLMAAAEKHPLYDALGSVENLRVFMELHVFAVWDFMCLLKALQRAFTSVDRLWVPTRSPEARRFINEIAVAEECDRIDGRVESHFELYLRAMREVGADTTAIDAFLRQLTHGASLETALTAANVPAAAATFVRTTMGFVDNRPPHGVAAAFTLGRERVIPGMFLSILATVAPSSPTLLTYFERHVALDGEEHGPLSLQLLTAACGTDPRLWEEATQAAVDALRARHALWDGVLAAITARNRPRAS